MGSRQAALQQLNAGLNVDDDKEQRRLALAELNQGIPEVPAVPGGILSTLGKVAFGEDFEPAVEKFKKFGSDVSERFVPSMKEFGSGLATIATSPIQTGRQLGSVVTEGAPFSAVIRGGAQELGRQFAGSGMIPEDAEQKMQTVFGEPTQGSRLVQEMLKRPISMLKGAGEGNIDPILEAFGQDPFGTAVGAVTSTTPFKAIQALQAARTAINPIRRAGQVLGIPGRALKSEATQTALRSGLGKSTGVGSKPLDIAEDIGRQKMRQRLGTMTDEDVGIPTKTGMLPRESPVRSFERGREAGAAPATGEGLAGEVGLEAASKLVARATEIDLPRKARNLWRRAFKKVKLKDPGKPVQLNNIRGDINKILLDRNIGVKGWAAGKTELDFSGITSFIDAEQVFIRNAVKEVDKLKIIDPNDFATMHLQLRKLRKIRDKALKEGFGDTESLMNKVHSAYRKELGSKLDNFDQTQSVFKEVTEFAGQMRRDFLDISSRKKRKEALRIVSNKTVSRLNNALSDRAEDAQRLATLETFRDAFGGFDLPRYLAGIQLSRKGPKGIAALGGITKRGAGAGVTGGVGGFLLAGPLGVLPGAIIGKGIDAVSTLIGNMTIRSPKNVGRFYLLLGGTKEVADHVSERIQSLQRFYPNSGPDVLDTITIAEAVELAQRRDPSLRPKDVLTTLGSR